MLSYVTVNLTVCYKLWHRYQPKNSINGYHNSHLETIAILSQYIALSILSLSPTCVCCYNVLWYSVLQFMESILVSTTTSNEVKSSVSHVILMIMCAYVCCELKCFSMKWYPRMCNGIIIVEKELLHQLM